MTYEEFFAAQKALHLKHKREIEELRINKFGPCPHQKGHFDLASLLIPCISLLHTGVHTRNDRGTFWPLTKPSELKRDLAGNG
jgi:hypothetical protein